MEALTYIGILLSILAFSVLIISHEFGHFLFAKLNGVLVEEFSVGMGPRILSWKGRETRYSLKAVPFGGSCMMLGEDEDSTDERAFGTKSVWARMSILAAGPVFNFLLAFILALVVLGSMGIDRPVLSSVAEGSPAERAGMQAGDEIVRLDRETIHFNRDITLYRALNPGDNPLEVTYLRDGKKHTVTLVPEYDEESGSYMMGVRFLRTREKMGPLETMKYSAYEVGYWIHYTFISLKMIFSGQVGVKDVSGPVGMVSSMSTMVKEASASGAFYIFINLANFCILLSANLGVMNLLPLPALDGGRLLFCLIELLRGKPVKQEYEAVVHGIGLLLLLGLSVLVLVKDVWQIFG